MPSAPEPIALPPRSVLVTGVSGFVGLKLAKRLLAQDCKVAGICRKPRPDLEKCRIEMIYADLADASAIRAACQGRDTVFHVAAKVGIWGKLTDFQAANVEGTQAIINGCRDFEVKKLVYTSTPSVVFNGRSIAGQDESLPYGENIPCPYPTTKVIAEKAVLAAHDLPPGHLKTVALRPHLIWGNDDTNLVPRVVERARAGKLRIVGDGDNRVDLTHVDNVVDAHLLAEAALDRTEHNPGGKAYFISNGEPVKLWEWINELLESHDIPRVHRRISLPNARRIGAVMETLWKLLRLHGEPPMTRFVASELAKDHWFDISAAQRDLGYRPRINMAEGMARLLSK
ncbi:NAD-dependent epimerase/dehydratase family protein [Pelagicoccus sp. SDUM812002]|uniref:NAD-dependent epimerase/dehydratase family protein n=1 Tax=Pelagicoccus sp. SDUM812002 TaxID=3041266 RepID=UPI00280DFC26|nr:NAD-dependent epimerase/dehydratase family protein [Pelagicoccus sp. SDUM812002]MDQ8184906.1 NAD-dependent epimerase/dehydratase family protein [Pelagicoccus sp. SDUM812002]